MCVLIFPTFRRLERKVNPMSNNFQTLIIYIFWSPVYPFTHLNKAFYIVHVLIFFMKMNFFSYWNIHKSIDINITILIKLCTIYYTTTIQLFKTFQNIIFQRSLTSALNVCVHLVFWYTIYNVYVNEQSTNLFLIYFLAETQSNRKN